MTMTLLLSQSEIRCAFELADLNPAVLDGLSLHIDDVLPSCVYAMIQRDIGTVDVSVAGEHGTLFDAVFVQAPNGRQFLVGLNCVGALCAGRIL